jgi:hypothetical protein
LLAEQIPTRRGISEDDQARGAAWVQEFCTWADRWGLDISFASRLVKFAENFPAPVDIISGYRTDAEQRALIASGEATLAPELSNHCACPAWAADIWPQIAVTNVVKASVGPAARVAGLRWGGGSPVNPQGIPSDWNHLDEGPRSAHH